MKRIAIVTTAAALLLAGCGSANTTSEEGGWGPSQAAAVEAQTKPAANPAPILKTVPGCEFIPPSVGMGTSDTRWADCYDTDAGIQARVTTYNAPVTPGDVGVVEEGQVKVVLSDQRTVVSSFGHPTAEQIIAALGGTQVPVTP